MQCSLPCVVCVDEQMIVCRMYERRAWPCEAQIHTLSETQAAKKAKEPAHLQWKTPRLNADVGLQYVLSGNSVPTAATYRLAHERETALLATRGCA